MTKAHRELSQHHRAAARSGGTGSIQHSRRSAHVPHVHGSPGSAWLHDCTPVHRALTVTGRGIWVSRDTEVVQYGVPRYGPRAGAATCWCHAASPSSNETHDEALSSVMSTGSPVPAGRQARGRQRVYTALVASCLTSPAGSTRRQEAQGSPSPFPSHFHTGQRTQRLDGGDRGCRGRGDGKRGAALVLGRESADRARTPRAADAGGGAPLGWV